MLFKVQYIVTRFIKKLYCHHGGLTRDIRSVPQYFSAFPMIYNTDVCCYGRVYTDVSCYCRAYTDVSYFYLNPNDPRFILLSQLVTAETDLQSWQL